MRFEARELKSYAEPVSVSELTVGNVYFAVQFIDSDMLIPELEALVFIGRDLVPNDALSLYFQDAGSYRHGIRFDSAKDDEATFYKQTEDEIQHIFEYEQALDILLTCSLRRQQARGKGVP